MHASILVAILSVGAPALKDRETAPSLVGQWEVESIGTNGNQNVATARLRYTFTEDGKWLIHRNGKETAPGISRGYTADPKRKPPSVDLLSNTAAVNGSRLVGIYKVDGDTLTICGTRAKGADRPTTFEAGPGSGRTVYVLKRAKQE